MTRKSQKEAFQITIKQSLPGFIISLWIFGVLPLILTRIQINRSQWPLEVFIMQPDFSAMTKSEIRAYVIVHPDDKSAFHTFVDRFTSDASPETFNIPNSNAEIAEVEFLIKQKLEQLKTS
jgi:hypothetical protein